MKIHHVTVSAYAKRQDAEAVKKAIQSLLPTDVVTVEKVIEPETEGGVFMNELVEYSAKITGQSDIKIFYSMVMSKLDRYDKEKILSNLENYVDDECNFYIRLGKSEAASGNIVLEPKDSIHVTFKIAAFPAHKDIALGIVRKMIEDEAH